MGCAALHDVTMRNLQVARIEMGEIWSFVGKKQCHLRQGDPAGLGDVYAFLALTGAAKAIISYHVGKRDGHNTQFFVADLRNRVLGVPEISSDAWAAYLGAVEAAFGIDCHFGTIEKHYAVDQAVETARRYSPAHVVAISKHEVVGLPQRIGTSHVERQNLTLRTQQQRFTRLTNAFSKEFENHVAAVALYVAHYNLCRVHEASRVIPAMQLGVSDHIWTVGELVDAALDGVVAPELDKPHGRFRVIDGGLS